MDKTPFRKVSLAEGGLWTFRDVLESDSKQECASLDN